MKKIILIAMLAIAAFSKTFAQLPDVVLSDKTGWHKIGETTVSFKTETDEILVMGADKFATIKIKVTDAPIDLISYTIYFENGDNQMVKVGQKIKGPGETKEVALKGGERSIKKIVLTYRTVPNSKDEKAHLELWGLKTNTDKKK